MPVTLIKNDEHFDEIITNSKKKYIVAQFTTNWSGACREFADKYEETSSRYPNVKFISINIDDGNEDLADNLNINSVPTFLFFESGKLVPLHIVVTKASQQQLNQALNKIMNGGGHAPFKERSHGHNNGPHRQHPAQRRHRNRDLPSPRRRPNRDNDRNDDRYNDDRYNDDRYNDDKDYRYHKPSARGRGNY